MAIASAALAYRRSALMTASKVTNKPPSEEILAARDDFHAFCKAMGKPPAKHMLEWHVELCTGVDSECLLGIGGQNTAILAPRGSAKRTVLGLFAAWMMGRHAAAKQMLRILYIAYMVDISRAKSATIKGILTSPKYREIFPMVRLSKIKRSDEYWSIDYEFAGLIQQVRKHSPLRVEVSKGLLLRSDPNLCLSMTLSNLRRRSITLTFGVKWSKRGVTLLHRRCFRAPERFALGPVSTLTMSTPRFLYRRITGNRLFRKQS